MKYHGAGLGLRREMLNDQKKLQNLDVDFFEIAPENWMTLGGQFQKELRMLTERYPFSCHGLSLSLGGTEPLDMNFLKNVKTFFKEHDISLYTEHLSWCTDDGHLYDLLPIPCTEEAINWIANRIKTVQDVLEMPIGIENVSYYIEPAENEMKEEQFITEIIERSGCFLHLDVNNIYVNSQNFKYDPYEYLANLPLHKTGYIHVAGHFTEEDGLIVDSHGADVIDPVWALLNKAYELIGDSSLPTCLERDFNFPSLESLMEEVDMIKDIQKKTAQAQPKIAIG